jgi:hypothetical protein
VEKSAEAVVAKTPAERREEPRAEGKGETVQKTKDGKKRVETWGRDNCGHHPQAERRPMGAAQTTNVRDLLPAWHVLHRKNFAASNRRMLKTARPVVWEG